ESQQPSVVMNSEAGGADVFNPWRNAKLPQSRHLSKDGTTILGSIGGKEQSIQAEAAHRPHWREEIYPVVFGTPGAAHEILVLLDFSEPASEKIMAEVTKAASSLQPNDTKIVVFGKNRELYGTDLTGLMIWIAYARKGQALPYLNFALKAEDSDSVPASELLDGITIQAENLLDGYWRDAGSANGVLVCPPVTNTELLSYYVANNAVYHIRYWETDMEYNPDAEALFTDGDVTYSVPRHLRSADKTYTCTLGRRTRIRNIEKSAAIGGDYELNSVLVEKHVKDEQGRESSYTVRTSTIIAFGKPYLTLTDGSQDLQTIIASNNVRRHPAQASPFPPHGVLDFDWSIVENPPASYDRRVLDLGK
ncbi:MAG: hypothetical protein II837_07290, partial [Treponema sp.]|nr:hypothetical protein [Treponema sp.]